MSAGCLGQQNQEEQSSVKDRESFGQLWTTMGLTRRRFHEHLWEMLFIQECRVFNDQRAQAEKKKEGIWEKEELLVQESGK